ncbi:sigma-70 family RNA polymerase sigma factor [Streptomyces sp. HYC2]|uniref:sigma-70 family RNA polymerase sigma factor n=1 Tax=Streptomyces sp. HYC2 TaxID=2955207 RepID=UPI002480FD2C|nr:sigma-70 family RNA polymerase sigma factor [Streptomyces sp. HYC2]
MLGDLLKRLRRAAVHGVVPEREFLQGVRALALDDGERGRLRNELAQLGLPVRDLRMHADIDSPSGEKVARMGEEIVFSRVELARTVLSRYRDAAGCVTSRALEGVVRLVGLDSREAAELRAGASVRRDPDGAVAGEAGGWRGSQESHEATVAATPDEAATAATGGDLADALAAARAVLEADRTERRPEKRLLSAEAEVGLAVLVRGGVDRIEQEADEDELKALPRDDLRVRARDCLVVHNLRLVHSIVRSHLEQGLDYDDLVQHGALGLMRAARKFDPRMGNKFSTYATWWVRQSMTRAIADEGAIIRIPVHMHEQIRKVANVERSLAAQGRPATAADVAVACDLSLEKVEQARKLSQRTDSLDRIIGDGATLADFVGRTQPLPSVEKQVLDALHAAEVMAVVNTFSGRDHRILMRRLGLDGDERSTLDELGAEFGVTRERIRQLEVKLRPELKERLRLGGLFGVNLDAECEKAERAAERAAEAARAAGIARATHAARTARARRALRRARAERLAMAAAEEAQVAVVPARTVVVDASGDAPMAEAAVEVTVVPEAEAAMGGEGTADVGEVADAGAMSLMSDTLTDAAEAASTEEDADVEAAIPTSDGVFEPAREAAGATVGDTGAEPDPEPNTVPTGYAADWGKARALARPPLGGGVAWLAEYALLAVGPQQLTVLLGSTAAGDVVRAARQRGTLDRRVVTALEVLESVFDTVKKLGLRPEHFFEWTSETLGGVSPRAYLGDRPLLRAESRVAVRDALKEFTRAAPGGSERTEPAPDGGEYVVDTSLASSAGVGELPAPPAAEAVPEPAHPAEGHDAQAPSEAPHQLLSEARAQHEAELVRLAQEHERQLAEERIAADERVAAARVEAERQLDALEEELLRRADRARERREQHVRSHAEERVARLKQEHHEAYQALLHRAEEAEEAARQTDGAAERVHTLERRLREYREGAEARIADLESRLWEAQAAVTERERATGAWVAELETRLRKAEAAVAERERATASAREEYRRGAQVRVAEVEARLREAEASVKQRDLFVEAARRRAEEAEQQVAQRIAQSEHDAWLRITELQTQLSDAQAQVAAAQEAAGSRTSLRDRWRRS